jgi:hypothetical protein
MTADAVRAFPSRFEMRYSLDEAMRYTAARQRSQQQVTGSGRAWTRLICLAFLMSGLGLVARALGLVEAEAMPAVATLFAVAFVAGVYAAWTEMGFASKRANRVLLDHGGVGFGPWQVAIGEQALEASVSGYSFRLDLAAVREVTIDDALVFVTIDHTINFAVPKRCFEGEQGAQAFKVFVESRRAKPAS